MNKAIIYLTRAANRARPWFPAPAEDAQHISRFSSGQAESIELDAIFTKETSAVHLRRWCVTFGARAAVSLGTGMGRQQDPAGWRWPGGCAARPYWIRSSVGRPRDLHVHSESRVRAGSARGLGRVATRHGLRQEVLQKLPISGSKEPARSVGAGWNWAIQTRGLAATLWLTHR